MLNFTLLTSTPAVLRTQLIARGILQNVAGVVATFEGFEYAQVPNPISTSLGPPVVMDTRLCYLVKLVRAAEADETSGVIPTTLLTGTKLGQWIAANSVADPIASADGRTFNARKVGTTFWFVREDDGSASAFGAWQ